METTPLRRSDIAPDRTYLTVEVHMDGSMHLDRWRAYGKPVRRNDGWWVRTAKRERGDPRDIDALANFQNLRDLGIGMRPVRETYHRTFADTPQNEFFLRRMLRRRSALKHYIAWLGYANPDLHVLDLKVLYARRLATDELHRIFMAAERIGGRA